MGPKFPADRDDVAEDAAGQPPVAPPAIRPPGLIRRDRQVRDLILDYALGIAILGLIPIPRLFTLKLLLALGFMLKMGWDIGRLWRWRRGQDVLAIAGALFGGLGAVATALVVWLTCFGIGVFVPYFKGLALAAALFTLPWALGQSVNQFFASGAEAPVEQP
jgi:uncharacterized protein (DUF697 family)